MTGPRGITVGPMPDTEGPRTRSVRVRPVAAVLAGVLAAGCASTATSEARLTPLDGRTLPLTAALERSCTVGDCRTQRVRMRLPEGETLEGTLTLRTQSVPSEGTTAVGPVLVAPSGDPLATTTAGIMRLTGAGGTGMTCEVVFANDLRRGTGICTAASGARYALGF